MLPYFYDLQLNLLQIKNAKPIDLNIDYFFVRFRNSFYICFINFLKLGN